MLTRLKQLLSGFSTRPVASHPRCRIQGEEFFYMTRKLLLKTKVSWIVLCGLTVVLTGCLEPVDSGVDAGLTGGTGVPPLPGNNAPTITGTPATEVVAGVEYSFTPTANDPDGDTLTFSITNQPDWAQFDPSDGTLQGIPTLAQIGYFGDIVISVQDQSAVSSLSSFGISVSSNSPNNASYVGFGSKTQGANSCSSAMEAYEVTSLSGGTGVGTLRDAVSQDCRYITFGVAGEIDLGRLQISKSFLTIDGSSAPSPGISLVNVERLALEASGGVAVHDVIVNNIRATGLGGAVETNDLWELDGSSGAPIYNIILDHLTMSSSGDGNVDIYGDVFDITLSNSLIMDSVEGHHFSDINGLRERLTIFGNVYGRVNERQPRIRYNTRQLDYVGNVIYGWGWQEGGAAGMHIDVGSGTPSVNVEKNVYHFVAGLNGVADEGLKIDDISGSWFFSDNTWPTGESQGDTAMTTGRVSMLSQGVDYSAPRQTTDIISAGMMYKTADEEALLAEIDDAVNGGSGGGGTGGGGTGGGGTGGGGTGSGYVPPDGETSYRGIPSPSGALGFDVWADYTVDQVITGSNGQDSINCVGTAADPCLIDATNADFTKLTLSGSYVILQGGLVNAPAGSGPWFSANGCTRCVIRDLEVSGPRVGTTHSAAVSLSNFTVWIRGSVHGFGDNRPDAPEQDYHGFKVQSTDIWILEAEIYDVSGDSVQVGDASRGSGERVYMGGGYYHHNRENAVDIKDSLDVVVSGVLMEGFRPTSSSPGEAVVLHDDAVGAKIYDNIVLDSTIGMVSSGLSGHIIDGNNITALSVGIQLRNTRDITVTNNIVNAPLPIEVQGGVTGTVQ
jgi:pectate lyase